MNPIEKNPWWLPIAAIIPALLATILIFMDQQITAVIVNRKENKLKVFYNQAINRTLFYINLPILVIHMYNVYTIKGTNTCITVGLNLKSEMIIHVLAL